MEKGSRRYELWNRCALEANESAPLWRLIDQWRLSIDVTFKVEKRTTSTEKGVFRWKNPSPQQASQQPSSETWDPRCRPVHLIADRHRIFCSPNPLLLPQLINKQPNQNGEFSSSFCPINSCRLHGGKEPHLLFAHSPPSFVQRFLLVSWPNVSGFMDLKMGFVCKNCTILYWEYNKSAWPQFWQQVSEEFCFLYCAWPSSYFLKYF